MVASTPDKVAVPPTLPPADWMRAACTPDMVAVPPADRLACSPAAACARPPPRAHVGERADVHVHLEALHQDALDREGEGLASVGLRGVGPAKRANRVRVSG